MSISNLGVMAVELEKGVKPYQLNNSTLNITTVPASNFTWVQVENKNDSFELQFNFSDPLSISSSLEQDKIILEILDQELFVTEEDEILESFELVSKLTKQLPVT